MFLARKIAKLKKLSAIQHKDEPQPPRFVKPNKKTLRCRFSEIPPPSKYMCSNPIYSLYGDLPLMYYKGELVTELSLYNHSKSYKDIAISQMNEQTLVTIRPTLKTDSNVQGWNELCNMINASNDINDDKMREWAQIVKSFSHTYSKVMQRQSRKKMKSEPRKQFFYQVTDQTTRKNQTLFENYPCLKLKFRIKNHQNTLKEIVMNDSFIKGLGHTVETFTTSILQEGFPQLMPYNNPLAPVVMKTLIKNYFTIGDCGHEVVELSCPLLMKDDFARNVNFKTYFLMNYEDSVFGMDVIFTVTKADEPYLLPKVVSNPEVNEEFTEFKSSIEKETDYFVSSFYDKATINQYTNFYNSCILKEIQDEDTDHTVDESDFANDKSSPSY